MATGTNGACGSRRSTWRTKKGCTTTCTRSAEPITSRRAPSRESWDSTSKLEPGCPGRSLFIRDRPGTSISERRGCWIQGAYALNLHRMSDGGRHVPTGRDWNMPRQLGYAKRDAKKLEARRFAAVSRLERGESTAEVAR